MFRPAPKTRGRRIRHARLIRRYVAVTYPETPPTPKRLIIAALYLDALLAITTRNRFRLVLEHKSQRTHLYSPITWRAAEDLIDQFGYEEE